MGESSVPRFRVPHRSFEELSTSTSSGTVTKSAENPLIFAKYGTLSSMTIQEEPEFELTLDSFDSLNESMSFSALVQSLEDTFSLKKDLANQEKLAVKLQVYDFLQMEKQRSNLSVVLEALHWLYLENIGDPMVGEKVKDLLEAAQAGVYCLVFGNEENLQGVYYQDHATGVFHRIFGGSNARLILSPDRVTAYLQFDRNARRFIAGSLRKFDAICVELSNQ